MALIRFALRIFDNGRLNFVTLLAPAKPAFFSPNGGGGRSPTPRAGARESRPSHGLESLFLTRPKFCVKSS